MARQTLTSTCRLIILSALLGVSTGALAIQISARASYYDVSFNQVGPGDDDSTATYRLTGGKKGEVSLNSGRWFIHQFHSLAIGILLNKTLIASEQGGSSVIPDGTRPDSSIETQVEGQGLGAHINWRLSPGKKKSRVLTGTFLFVDAGISLQETDFDVEQADVAKKRFRFKTQAVKGAVGLGYSWGDIEVILTKDYERLKLVDGFDRDNNRANIGKITGVRDLYTLGVSLTVEGGMPVRL